MIDFPSPATDGQVFSAPNGVVYKYSATYSSWLAQNPAPPLGGTGQVTAISSANSNVTAGGGDTLAPFATVQSGNAGLWWNTSTNRYTPPAGSYFISAIVNFVSAAGSNSTWTLKLRKNGVAVGVGTNGSVGPSFASMLSIAEYVDANGTDFFDVVVSLGTGSASPGSQQGGIFSAFPLTGMQGPTGVISNGFRLISRVVPTASQVSVDFTSLPSDINDLELRLDVTPATAGTDLILQFYDNTGALDNTTGHYNFVVTMANNVAASGSAPQVYSNAAIGYSTGIALDAGTAAPVGNTTGIRGRATISNIRDTRVKNADFQTSYVDNSNTAFRAIIGSGQRTIAGAITGLRLIPSSGNLLAGGAVSLWGSP